VVEEVVIMGQLEEIFENNVSIDVIVINLINCFNIENETIINQVFISNHIEFIYFEKN